MCVSFVLKARGETIQKEKVKRKGKIEKREGSLMKAEEEIENEECGGNWTKT